MARSALVITSIYQRQAYWQARTKHALLIAAKLEDLLLTWNVLACLTGLHMYMLATDEWCQGKDGAWGKRSGSNIGKIQA